MGQAQVKASDIYKAYKAWCGEQGMKDREIMTNNAFGRRMGQKFKKVHDRAGAFYQGVGMTCDGFVTDFEPSTKNYNVFPLMDSSRGDNIEIPSQSVTTPDNPSQDLNNDIPEYPHLPCFSCKGTDYWLTDDNRWLCGNCHPEPKGGEDEGI